MSNCLNFQQLAALEKRAKPFLWLSNDWNHLTLDEGNLNFQYFKVLVLDAFSHFGYHIFHSDFVHFFLEEVKKKSQFLCLHMDENWGDTQWRKQGRDEGPHSKDGLVNFYLLISYRLLSVPQDCFRNVGLSWMSEDTLQEIRRGQTEKLPTVLAFTMEECLNMVHRDYSLKYQLALLAFATYSKKTKHQTILRIDINETNKDQGFIKVCLQVLELICQSPSTSLPMSSAKIFEKLKQSQPDQTQEEVVQACFWLTEAGYLWKLGKRKTFDLCEKSRLFTKLYFAAEPPARLGQPLSSHFNT